MLSLHRYFLLYDCLPDVTNSAQSTLYVMSVLTSSFLFGHRWRRISSVDVCLVFDMTYGGWKTGKEMYEPVFAL
jgi:hypothetical protein